jgi:hypothetical protein
VITEGSSTLGQPFHRRHRSHFAFLQDPEQCNGDRLRFLPHFYTGYGSLKQKRLASMSVRLNWQLSRQEETFGSFDPVRRSIEKVFRGVIEALPH